MGAIAISALDDVVAAGSVGGTVDFGSGPRTVTLPAGWIASWTTAGAARWDRIYVNPGSVSFREVGTFDGQVFAAGRFDFQVDFGEGYEVATSRGSPVVLSLRD